MGQTDWQFLQSGDPILDARQDNALVPDDQLVHDIYCRRFDGGHSHLYFKYISLPFNVAQDFSVRSAFSIEKTDVGKQSVGVGCRMDENVEITPVSDILNRFSPNGYHLLIEDDYMLRLYRSINSVTTTLFATQLIGTNGFHKWFHIRLDFLLQTDGRAVLQVYTNNVQVNGVTIPIWNQISPDIIENASVLPPYTRAGIGGQLETGQPLYVDTVEIFRS